MIVDPKGVGTVNRLSQLEALSGPVRTRILRAAGRPTTVAELAEGLQVPKTRLYYHVNLLIEEGMLAQVDDRKSGARIEKIYLRTASDYQMGDGLVEEIGDPRKAAEATASVVLDPARTETEDILERTFRGEEVQAEISRVVAQLKPEDVERFEQALGELTEAMRRAHSDEGSVPYALTVTFVPTDSAEASDVN
jgi:DNA-binding transcriptional ArsR family regulator